MNSRRGIFREESRSEKNMSGDWERFLLENSANPVETTEQSHTKDLSQCVCLCCPLRWPLATWLLCTLRVAGVTENGTFDFILIVI